MATITTTATRSETAGAAGSASGGATAMGEDGRRVLRRCGRCRLLFEVESGGETCIVCGAQLAGLALPITEPVPSEVVEGEPTERLKTT